MSNKKENRCEKCGAIVPRMANRCAFCETKKAGTAVKKLFGHLFNDAKNLLAKAQNIRVKTDD